MSVLTKKKFIPASNAAGIVRGSGTAPMQTGLTCKWAPMPILEVNDGSCCFSMRIAAK
jgi:hypothetical protein